ncbi:MAG: hypothetical protein WD377_04030 [Nitriliruptoraceae bacterium]
MRRQIRAAALAAATVAMLLPAGTAWAHPYIVGGEVAVDSSVEVTLAMAHGCGTESDAGGDPTREIAIEVDEWLRIIDVPVPDGWQVDVETDARGRVEAVVWTATTAEVAAPQVTFTAVVHGTAGQERYLAVYQGCDDFAYRWIGTPDEPAADPAVRVRLAPADPLRPPPQDPPPDDAAASPSDVAPADPPDAPSSETSSASDDGADDEEATSGVPSNAPQRPADAATARVPGALVVGGLVALALAAGWWWRRRA